MERICNVVLRHRRLVIVFWLLAMVAGGALAGKTIDRLTTDFSVPNEPGFQAIEAINDALGQNTENGPSLPILTVPPGQSVQERRTDVAEFFDRVRADHPQWRIADYGTTGNENLITDNGRTTYALVYGPPPTSFGELPFGLQIVEQYGPTTPDGLQVGATGYFELAVSDAESSGETESGNTQLIIEVLFGAAGALLVLVFVFASFLALLPLLVAAVSILVTFGVLLPFTYLLDMSIVLQFLLAFIGLGVAIDYSLLVVTRWREERQHGKDNVKAVRIAVSQAGHSVVFSGVAVAIGLLSLVVLRVPFLRSMGIGGVLIPLVSTLVAITLVPALLASIGPAVDRPRIRKEVSASRFWTRWTGGVVKRPWTALAAALVLLGLMAAPVFGIKLGNASIDSLTTEPSPITRQFDALIAGGVPEGVLTPLEVLTTGDPEAVTEALSGLEEVAFTLTPGPESGFVNGQFSVVEVIPTVATVNSDTNDIVVAVQEAVQPLPGVVGVAGIGAVLQDYNNGIYQKLPLVLLVLSVLTFLALTRAFRSAVLAFKAVLLNVISLAATFGVLVWVWQLGNGSELLFDTSSTGSITFWVPIMVFAFLYGLSMDYEVFILTRVREEYDRTGDTNKALVEGLGRTGRLVTSAALILFLSFVALAASPGTDVKILATGLAVGILLDATIVRLLLVPALVVLLADWNWYLPDPMAKVLRVEPSRAPESEREPAPV